ncbi:MAG: arsenosugar biosynthesis radical SAM protein ArsS, partial [Vicinamibacterales bacterium]
MLVTLANSRHPLSNTATQRATLAEVHTPRTFEDAVAGCGHAPLRAAAISTLQINLGKRCNQACRHCHVDAGPDRREVMPPHVVDACLSFLDASDIP